MAIAVIRSSNSSRGCIPHGPPQRALCSLCFSTSFNRSGPHVNFLSALRTTVASVLIIGESRVTESHASISTLRILGACSKRFMYVYWSLPFPWCPLKNASVGSTCTITLTARRETQSARPSDGPVCHDLGTWNQQFSNLR
jgi:hypothetical protein